MGTLNSREGLIIIRGLKYCVTQRCQPCIRKGIDRRNRAAGFGSRNIKHPVYSVHCRTLNQQQMVPGCELSPPSIIVPDPTSPQARDLGISSQYFSVVLASIPSTPHRLYRRSYQHPCRFLSIHYFEFQGCIMLVSKLLDLHS